VCLTSEPDRGGEEHSVTIVPCKSDANYVASFLPWLELGSKLPLTGLAKGRWGKAKNTRSQQFISCEVGFTHSQCGLSGLQAQRHSNDADACSPKIVGSWSVWTDTGMNIAFHQHTLDLETYFVPNYRTGENIC
jgi:hypothetical protein